MSGIDVEISGFLHFSTGYSIGMNKYSVPWSEISDAKGDGEDSANSVYR